MNEVKVLKYRSTKCLTDEMDRLVNVGWLPSGGVSVSVCTDDPRYKGNIYCQTMVKYTANDSERQKVTAIVTLPEPHFGAAKERLAKALVRKFAGVTMSKIDGYWSPDGDCEMEEYQGSVIAELALKIECLVMPNRSDECRKTISSTLSALNAEMNWGARWLHVEVATAKAHHTDLHEVSLFA